MYYFVYDLDETLAEVYSLFYFLMSLRIKNKVPKEFYNANVTLFNKLERAYYDFVKRVAQEEKSDRPLGILRPGILTIMREIETLRENKKVKGMIIYSNNGNIENLEFIKDVIVDGIMPSNNDILSMNFNNFISSGILIKNLIHWGHPERNSEIPVYYNNKGKPSKRPGIARKTWEVLHRIVTKNGTENPDFTPENVFFFDDISPEHSIKAELGDNYYRVPRYDFKASSERLGEIFKSVMTPIVADPSFDMRLYMNILQRSVVGEIQRNARLSDLDNLVNTLKRVTGTTAALNAEPPLPETDYGIRMMEEAIFRVRGATAGGKRRRIKDRTRKRKLKRNRTKARVRKN
jgi:hypothetical protein